MKYTLKHVKYCLFFIACIFIYNLIVRIYMNGFLFGIGQYFIMPAYSLMGMAIAVLFAYFFTQNGHYLRNNMDVATNIIERLLFDLNNEQMWTLSHKNDIYFVLLKQRTISNRLKLLNEYEHMFNFTDYMEYTMFQFNSYWDLVSNHTNDVDYLKKSQRELHNSIENMISKLEALIVYIHK